jgi:hypothetical protein
MHNHSFESHQADLRVAYAHGAPGVLVSGLVWLAAALTALTVGAKASFWVLLLGGMAIFPLSLVACRLVGASGRHTKGNPLGLLAIEGTIWLMAGIFIALATSFTGQRLFFPVMLLTIGSRYLSFQTLYGLRHYWFAGGALCAVGFASAALPVPTWAPAAAGSGIEIALALALFARRRQDQGMA